jgi:hypothetical protein
MTIFLIDLAIPARINGTSSDGFVTFGGSG